MIRRLVLAVGAVALPTLVAATPAQDLYRAYQLFDRHQWRPARDLARAYLAANGPNYSAELIVAGSECMLHPHLRSNASPFQRILAEYVLPSRQQSDIAGWIARCISPPPPPPPPPQAGVSVAGLSVGPNTAAAAPSASSPQLRRPPPVAPTSAAVAPGPVKVPAADRCRDPFVWRQAFPGDHVCVAMQVRLDAADDNAHAAGRRDPTGPYGPLTCINGYVWRAAREGDAVCVVPQRRDQAAADNAVGAARRLQPQGSR